MQMKFTLRQLWTTLRHMSDELDLRTAERDPITQFQKWFADARSARIILPDAMMLATVTADGKPAARMVLLKSVDDEGFVFFTNYESDKARELAKNPFGALVFHWEILQRQVRINGVCSRLSAEESDAYFATRPRDSQISAHASPQSRIIENREELEMKFKRSEELYRGKDVPRPANWGGFCLKPASIEFWKGRVGRLHDRILYELRPDKTWTMKRLAP